MQPLEKLVIESLASLGGSERYVAGAALGARASKNAALNGLSFKEELRAARTSLLHLLSESTRFEVIERPGTDFFVRLRSAEPANEGEKAPARPIAPTSRRLRADVYDAFTRIGKPFALNRESGRFEPIVQGQETDQNLALPLITLERVIADRSLFADTLSEPLRTSAKECLLADGGVRNFKDLLITKHRFGEWILFHNQVLSTRVIDWAKANGIEAPDAWFESKERVPTAAIFRKDISRIIMSMSDEDLGELPIPLKYIRHLFDR